MAHRLFGVLLGCLTLFAMSMSLALADGTPNPIGRPPGFKQGKKDIYGVWYEDGQWHLRMTSRDGKGRTVFTGMVKVDGDRMMGDFSALEKAKKAKNADWVVFHPDRRGFDFRFANRGATDGVAFKVGPKARTVTFKLELGDDDDPRRILIGGNNAHPDRAEFTLPAHPGK
jgi:hypothetical protein